MQDPNPDGAARYKREHDRCPPLEPSVDLAVAKAKAAVLDILVNKPKRKAKKQREAMERLKEKINNPGDEV